MSVEVFDLCQISHTIPCLHCMKCFIKGIVIAVLVFSFTTSTKTEHGEVRCSHSFKGSHQPSSTWSIRRSESIPSGQRLSEKGEDRGIRIYSCVRFQNQESYIGCTQEICKHWDTLAGEDHLHFATWSEKSRYEKAWTTSLNSQGNTAAPLQSRADFPQALAKRRKMKKEAAEARHQFVPIIRPDLQIRKRQGQQFQRHNERSTGHAMTGTTQPAHIKHGETCCVVCRSRLRLDTLVAIFQFMVVIYRMAWEVSAFF